MSYNSRYILGRNIRTLYFNKSESVEGKFRNERFFALNGIFVFRLCSTKVCGVKFAVYQYFGVFYGKRAVKVFRRFYFYYTSNVLSEVDYLSAFTV